MKKHLIYLLLIIALIISTTIWILNIGNNDGMNNELKVEIAPVREKSAELVTLYFSDQGRQYLVRENRVIEHTGELPEKIILEEVIKGPVNPRNIGLVPSSVKVHSIETKDDITYVYLSNEFKSDMKIGSNNEVLAIYSIVNSLTELKTINSVKIIVEGAEQYVLQKYMPLDHVYRQDLSLVNKPIKNPIEVVKAYFSFVEKEEYRQAFDLLYNPFELNLDYSMYYHYQKGKNIGNHTIYTYKMVEEGNSRIVTFDYSEINHDGEEFYYKDKDFRLKNYYGEWKIVIESISKHLNNNTIQ